VYEDISSRRIIAVAVALIPTTTRSIDMHITHVQPKRPTALPVYFLGRPAELYRRRYRRGPGPTTPRS
jgi:hypothetical protein